MSKLLLLTIILATSIIPAKSLSARETITLTPENTVAILTQISRSSVSQAVEELIRLDDLRGDKDYTIYITLDSPGGSIMAGNDFIEFANTVKNIKVICKFCASMAHAILQGINAERLVTKDNMLMAHRASGTFSGQFEDGELESRLKVLKSVVKSMEKRNANRIGISLEKYKSKVKDEWWAYGEESLSEKFADAIVDIKCSKSLINTKKSETTMTIFGPVKGKEKSQCILIP